MNIRDSKVSIIDSDGNIHLMGKAYERKTHITHLLKFLNENYGEIKGLKIGSSRNIYGYVFGKLGYIVYFNDSFSGWIWRISDIDCKNNNFWGLGVLYNSNRVNATTFKGVDKKKC